MQDASSDDDNFEEAQYSLDDESMFVDESDNLTSRAGLEPLSATSSHPTLPCN